jgi:ABC-type nickel/cobalt efflux system permease component RcnA
VWEFTADPAVARRAVFILAAQLLHQRIVLGAFVVALVFAVLAYVTGIMPLLGVAAAALIVAVVAWALWFTRWA